MSLGSSAMTMSIPWDLQICLTAASASVRMTMIVRWTPDAVHASKTWSSSVEFVSPVPRQDNNNFDRPILSLRPAAGIMA